MVNHQNNYRQEKKYTTDIINLNKIRHYLKSKDFEKLHSDNIVNNIYFDNSNKDSLYENIDGNEFRKKYRLRWYKDQDFYILEEKHKHSSSGFKHRNITDTNNLSDLILKISKDKNLKAIVKNSYKREYYFNKSLDIRVTIDYSLKIYKPFSNIYKSVNKTIVEYKYDTNNKYHISSIVPQFLQLEKFSKYQTGCELIGIKF